MSDVKINNTALQGAGLDILCWPFFEEKGEFDSGFVNVPGVRLILQMSILYYDNRAHTEK
jgi:hypothetical protein